MSDEKKCVHKMNMKGHGDPWCVLFRKVADCDDCHGVASGTFHKSILKPFLALGDTFKQAEGRCHRIGQKLRPIKDFHEGGTLRDAVGSKADAPVFTKHHETVMKRNKAEKMSRLFNIYGGTPERLLQLRRLDSLSASLQMHAAQLNYKQMLVHLIGRPGVTWLHDEFVIDEKEWVSPFTEGELVLYNDQLARVIKIAGPVIKIRLQRRDYPKHLNVMDWELEKRSVIKWVKKLLRRLWIDIE